MTTYNYYKINVDHEIRTAIAEMMPQSAKAHKKLFRKYVFRELAILGTTMKNTGPCNYRLVNIGIFT